MSSKLFREKGGIVNPFSKTIITLEVDDQLQTRLVAPNVHPKEVAKILMNVMLDLLFGYTEAVADAVDKSISNGG